MHFHLIFLGISIGQSARPGLISRRTSRKLHFSLKFQIKLLPITVRKKGITTIHHPHNSKNTVKLFTRSAMIRQSTMHFPYVIWVIGHCFTHFSISHSLWFNQFSHTNFTTNLKPFAAIESIAESHKCLTICWTDSPPHFVMPNSYVIFTVCDAQSNLGNVNFSSHDC